MRRLGDQVSATVNDLANLVSGQVIGDKTVCVLGASNLKNAAIGDITFVDATKYQQQFNLSKSLVAVCLNEFSAPGKTLILASDPLQAFVSIYEYFKGKQKPYLIGIDPLTQVSTSAKIGDRPTILPFTRIGDGSIIGTDCLIHTGVSIGRNCRIGNNVVLHANVVIYDDTVLENNIIIHANSVIGADGFGYRLVEGKHKKIPHLGNVEIGDNVEIGANSSIDRGTFGTTKIGEGTKIDNHVQIGHNCEIGNFNLIVAQVGIAGSCTTGDYVVLAGQSGLADHVNLADQVVVGAKSAVMRDAEKGERLLGIPARQERDEKRIIVSLGKLTELCRDVKKIKQSLQMPEN